MRKFLFFLMLFSLLSLDVNAQRDNKTTTGSRWWYGSSGQLGFSSSSTQGVFRIGLAPLAGYKVTPIFSAGPRVSLSLRNDRIEFFPGQVQKNNTWEYHIGAFGRLKPFEFIPVFLQAEGGFESRLENLFLDNNNELASANKSGFNSRLGIGYTSSNGSGGVASEIMLLYDLNLLNISQVELSPFEFRVGLTLFY